MSAPSFGDPRLPPRFWAKVLVQANGCWEWIGATTNDGYGRFRIGSSRDGTRRMIRSHRLAYEKLIGPIPCGLEPDHLCRNHACVNAPHLEPVTHAVNTRRGALAKGETNGRAKLTAEQVSEIRQLRGTMTQRKLAERFDIHHSQIGRIQRMQTWSWLTRALMRQGGVA